MGERTVGIAFDWNKPRSQWGVGFMKVTLDTTQPRTVHILPHDWQDYFVETGLVSANATLGFTEVPQELITELTGIKFSRWEAIDFSGNQRNLAVIAS